MTILTFLFVCILCLFDSYLLFYCATFAYVLCVCVCVYVVVVIINVAFAAWLSTWNVSLRRDCAAYWMIMISILCGVGQIYSIFSIIFIQCHQCVPESWRNGARLLMIMLFCFDMHYYLYLLLCIIMLYVMSCVMYVNGLCKCVLDWPCNVYKYLSQVKTILSYLCCVLVMNVSVRKREAHLCVFVCVCMWLVCSVLYVCQSVHVPCVCTYVCAGCMPWYIMSLFDVSVVLYVVSIKAWQLLPY